eukprot:761318-Hanusia_phi.AAC.5
MMDERIPKQISVGGFSINLERIRKHAVAKYSDLVDGLGGAIATSTRKRVSPENVFKVWRRSKRREGGREGGSRSVDECMTDLWFPGRSCWKVL